MTIAAIGGGPAGRAAAAHLPGARLLARIVAELALDGAANFPIAAFAPDRFAETA